MPVPKNILLYRLIHRENLEYIFNSELICCPNHPNRSDDYVRIGEKELIRLRSDRKIPIVQNKSFRDYVAFYLGP